MEAMSLFKGQNNLFWLVFFFTPVLFLKLILRMALASQQLSSLFVERLFLSIACVLIVQLSINKVPTPDSFCILFVLISLQND